MNDYCNKTKEYEDLSEKAKHYSALATLKLTAKIWFSSAVIGQWLFMIYVLGFYGGALVEGDLGAWNKAMPHGYVNGDLVGNLAVALHLLIAVIVMIGGPLQFVPAIRKKMPFFHRWNGRTYLISVVLAALGGLYMIWNRGTVGGIPQYIGISIDASLIIIFSMLTYHFARKRKFKEHRRWALRLFIVANAVWFYRIALMLWISLTGGVGIDFKNFQGPFLAFLAIAQFSFPLLILELYLRTEKSTEIIKMKAMSSIILVLTLLMGAGIYFAAVRMWLPRL